MIKAYWSSSRPLKRLKNQAYDLEVRIVGEIDKGNPSMIDTQMLADKIQSLKINYYGFVDDVRSIIDSSDCIVLPSYREGMPRVILEALAMARPVITTRTAGCRQTVDHSHNGYLVELQNTASLVDAMKEFMQLSSHQKIQMGQKGRKMAEQRFNSEKISQELYEIILQTYFCGK